MLRLYLVIYGIIHVFILLFSVGFSVLIPFSDYIHTETANVYRKSYKTEYSKSKLVEQTTPDLENQPPFDALNLSLTNIQIQRILTRYSKLDRVTIEQMARVIDEESFALNIDPFLVMAVMEAESRFCIHVVSARGALGPMQIMPVTQHWVLNRHKDLQVQQNQQTESPVLFNLRVGIRFLSALFHMFNDNTEHVLLAYNCGPDCVKKSRQTVDPKPLPPSTLSYAHRVLERYHYFKPKDLSKSSTALIKTSLADK